MSLNRVAFNNFIERAVSYKKSEFSEKKAGNLGPSEERILKEILSRGNCLRHDYILENYKEEKIVSNFITLDEIEKILK